MNIQPRTTYVNPHSTSAGTAAADQIRSCLLRSGSHHRPLWRPFLRLEPPAFLHHARLQPFLDQADDPLVSDPMLDELDQPTMFDFVEKCPDVQVQHPVHSLAHDPYRQRV